MSDQDTQLRPAWVALGRAEDLARQQAVGLTDEWNFTAALLMQARLLLEEAAAEGFEPVDLDGSPGGSCADLVAVAVSVLRDVPPDREPPQVPLALVAASDVLRALARRNVA